MKLSLAGALFPESGWITEQMPTVDGGQMDYIGHIRMSTESRPRIP